MLISMIIFLILVILVFVGIFSGVASDDDFGDNIGNDTVDDIVDTGVYRYSLEWLLDSDNSFDVDTVEGTIFTNDHLDREVALQHNITVLATKVSECRPGPPYCRVYLLYFYVSVSVHQCVSTFALSVTEA